MTDFNNPYQASAAALDGAPAGATYEPGFWAWKGRIGRLRYVAYVTGMSLLTMLFFGVAGGILAVARPNISPQQLELVPVYMMVLYIPLIAYSIAQARRRFNDTNRSGWLAVLMAVPFLNLLVSLYLLFAPGTDGPNDYGLPPSKNSWLVVLGGSVLPLVFIVGVLAAVAIPAYKDYTDKARAARSSSF